MQAIPLLAGLVVALSPIALADAVQGSCASNLQACQEKPGATKDTCENAWYPCAADCSNSREKCLSAKKDSIPFCAAEFASCLGYPGSS